MRIVMERFDSLLAVHIGNVRQVPDETDCMGELLHCIRYSRWCSIR